MCFSYGLIHSEDRERGTRFELEKNERFFKSIAGRTTTKSVSATVYLCGKDGGSCWSLVNSFLANGHWSMTP